MSDLSRRDLLTVAAVGAAGTHSAVAQTAHTEESARQERKPGVFTANEMSTLRILCDLILPVDDKGPAASAAKVPEWIELMSSQNDELRTIHTGGIAWMDWTMQKHQGKSFREASADQQLELLNLIAYRKNETKDNAIGPGVSYFSFLRMMVVDGYYTSKPGIAALGYEGNRAVEEFTVPQECVEWAISHSPGSPGRG